MNRLGHRFLRTCSATLTLLLFLSAWLATCPPASAETPAPAAPASPPKTKSNVSSAAAPAVSKQSTGISRTSLWSRVVMVGASATAGFTETEPLGGPSTAQYRLSRYLDVALLCAHEPVQNLAHAMFFLMPETAGKNQIEQALEGSPSLLIGVDFLFWFCYGEGRTDRDRLKRFEYGLKLLEAVNCPLVLGDIPDASSALNDMISEEQMPSLQAMSAANRRLKEWAESRGHVVILPLSRFMRTALANQAITVRGHTLLEGRTRSLLQRDKLHPTPPGCAVLALSILDVFVATQPSLSSAEILWNPKEVFRLGSTLTPASQAKQ